MIDGRCSGCDSRYCWDECDADNPNYAYVVGRGWVQVAEAEAIPFGTVHRIDWPKGHPLRGEGVQRQATEADALLTREAVQLSASLLS